MQNCCGLGFKMKFHYSTSKQGKQGKPGKQGKQGKVAKVPKTLSSAAALSAWVLSGDRAPVVAKKVRRTGHVKLKDIAWFADQLAVTQTSGVPLYRALGMLAGMRHNTPLGRRIVEVQRSISEGLTFAAALNLNTEVWGSMVCALVQAGEASGSLATSFQRIATLLNSRVELRRKIVGALMYPAMVLLITVLLVSTLLVFIVPRFKDIYVSLGSDLPAMTQLVVNLSAHAPVLFVVLLLLAGGIVFVLYRAKRDEKIGLWVDKLKLRIPVIGNLIAKGVYARVASTLASLLSSGVPLLEALEYAGAAANSHPHRLSLKAARVALSDGATFSAVLAQDGLWPDLMVQLVAVGEEAGSTPVMMERYAKRSIEEVDIAATGLTKLIEPVMMVVIGAVVGVFLLALYLPIFNLGSQLQ